MTKENKSLMLLQEQGLDAKKVLAVIKATPTEEVHTTYTKMKAFVAEYEMAMKEVFIKRIRSLKKVNFIESSLGKIILCRKNNYTYDEKRIEKFMEKKNIARNEVFSDSYDVVTIRQNVLDKLVQQGILVRVSKIDPAKLEKVSEKYPKILNYVENEQTEFLRGL